MWAVPQNTGNIALLKKASWCTSLSSPIYFTEDCHEYFVIKTSHSKQREIIKVMSIMFWYFFNLGGNGFTSAAKLHRLVHYLYRVIIEKY